MEIAWLTDNLADLDEMQAGKQSLSRLYFGNTFCQDLFPEPQEIQAAVELALRHTWAFSLVVPFITDRSLHRVRMSLSILEECLPGAEVVANDFGVLTLLQEKNLTPVAGRAFSKSKRDPRIQTLFPDLPEPLRGYYQGTNVVDQAWAGFLGRFGVERVECDWPPWGLDVSRLKASPLPVSIYIPFSYSATALKCPLQPSTELWGSVRCSRPCRRVHLEVGYPGLSAPLLVRGNTYYTRIADPCLPEAVLAEISDLRLVFQEPDLDGGGSHAGDQCTAGQSG